MHITIQNLLVWLLIALVVGVLGELLARRRAASGFIGAVIIGFIAIFLVVGVLGIHFANDLLLGGVPFFTSVLVAAILVVVWSSFAYKRVHSYGSRYYRRGTYARRPRRRRGLF